MALIKDLSGDKSNFADSSYTFSRCYCRVSDSVDMGRNNCTVRIDWWMSQAAREEGGKQPIYTSIAYAPGINNPEFKQLVAAANGDLVKALYSWLKTQPDFEGAEDA